MKLANVKITYHRSFQDSGEFDIEPDLTCLVKNEYGKTPGLPATYWLYPVEIFARRDVVIDFPAELTRGRRECSSDRRILCRTR